MAPRAVKVDLHVGARMRERRLMLGLTQQQMADLIGVTYQQTLKYEKGVNRIACGRLYDIAHALGVEVGYFFEGLGKVPQVTDHQRALLELARSFSAIKAPSHKMALCALSRALAGTRNPDPYGEPYEIQEAV